MNKQKIKHCAFYIRSIDTALLYQEEGYMSERKKVYFAGSIRGGRADAELYGKMIAHINKKADVLTEHVGKQNVFELEKSMTNRDIYEQDTAWIRACDLLIAECSTPSLGVGYELAYAEQEKKPCHILYRANEGSLSAMLAGNPYYTIHPYEKRDDVYPILDEILAQTEP